MIEEIIINFLKEKGFDVYTEKEANMPKEYILIEKIGGGEDIGIKNSTLAIQSFSRSLHKTAMLNEKVKAAMRACSNLDSICRCELNSDYNYTIANTREYRYQAVFDITHY